MKALPHALLLASCLTSVAAAQQGAAEKPRADDSPSAAYNQFAARKDVVVLTRERALAAKNKLVGPIAILTAWTPDSSEKAFAASFGGQMVDFHRLSVLEAEIDKVSKAIALVDRGEAKGTWYNSSITGLRVSYGSTTTDAGETRRSLWLALGSKYITQGASVSPLAELKELAGQMRAEVEGLRSRQEGR